MLADEIARLFESVKTPNATLIETHISWVILTDYYAWKIKKPVAFPFLDFSTLERRKHFCEREVVLNGRYSNNVYLGVVPITEAPDGSFTLEGQGQAVEYAVKMIRLENRLRMDAMISDGKLGINQMVDLAWAMSNAHQKADILLGLPDLEHFADHFAELELIMGKNQSPVSDLNKFEARTWSVLSHKILQRHQPRMYERAESGFFRDCHGDLHTANIFLYEKPIFFDCIEFDDRLRAMDILDEAAFLAMDMEAHGKEDLSLTFCRLYNHLTHAMQKPEDRVLFLFYKLYRASVRLKVCLLQSKGTATPVELVEKTGRYLSVCRKYAAELSAIFVPEGADAKVKKSYPASMLSYSASGKSKIS